MNEKMCIRDRVSGVLHGDGIFQGCEGNDAGLGGGTGNRTWDGLPEELLCLRINNIQNMCFAEH